jgi:hypothetical protein
MMFCTGSTTGNFYVAVFPSCTRSTCRKKEEHNTAFWYGFHPNDRNILRPHLFAENPFRPHDVLPFHFESVYDCAHSAFLHYDGFLPFRIFKQHFEPPSVRREWRRFECGDSDHPSGKLHTLLELTPVAQLPPRLPKSEPISAPLIPLTSPCSAVDSITGAPCTENVPRLLSPRTLSPPSDPPSRLPANHAPSPPTFDSGRPPCI